MSDIRDIIDYVQNINDQEQEVLQPLPEGSVQYDPCIVQFIDYILFMESQSHRWHLESPTHAWHVELNDFYQDLPEFVDAIVEGIMSTRGVLPACEGEVFVYHPIESAIDELERFKMVSTAAMQGFEQNGEVDVANSTLELVSLISSILMKLKYLN